jgi:hypothetical protein
MHELEVEVAVHLDFAVGVDDAAVGHQHAVVGLPDFGSFQ